jgi:hypothetical protein
MTDVNIKSHRMKHQISRFWMTWFAVVLAGSSSALAQCWPLPTSISSFRGEPGALITINGANFLSPQVTAVTFNFTPAVIESIRTISGGQQQIAVRVPVGATIGPIYIENSCGQTPITRNFQVPPVVTRFERPGGLTEADRVRGVAGNLVVLSGANFLDITDANFRLGVFFDGVRAQVDTVTETSVSVYVPAGAGTGPITVTNNAGVFITSTNFFIPPSVRGFTPRGRVGDTLSITGLSLRAVSAVTLGGVPVAAFTVVSPTNIAAVIPTNAPTSGALAVESPGGRFLTTSNFVLQPRIFGFTPTGGARGTNVTITGAGLTGVQQVRFGGIAATPTSVTATTVVVAVPFGAGTGPIQVVSPVGTDESTSTFHLAPTIAQLGSTRLRSGETLEITGTNFLGATAVRFGTNTAPSASFTVLDNRRISAVVPSNAITGRVVVETPGGRDESPTILSVVGEQPLITGFSPATGQVGAVVSVAGSHLWPFLSVRVGGVVAVIVQTNASGLAVTVPAGASSGRIVVETSAGIASSSSDFLVGSTAELTAEIESTANPVILGSEFRLNLRVRNAGPLPANGVRATLSLPSPSQFRGAATSSGSFAQVSGGVEFELGALAPNASWTGQVRLALTAPQEVVYSLAASSVASDSNVSDNIDTVRVRSIPLTLDFTGFDDLLVLSWPSMATNAVLQVTPALSPTGWTNTGLTPVDDGARLQVTLPATNGFQVFRLLVP